MATKFTANTRHHNNHRKPPKTNQLEFSSLLSPFCNRNQIIKLQNMKAEAEKSLPDYMNECFFSAVDTDWGEICKLKGEEKEFVQHRASRLTQEWLEEAESIVASCPKSRPKSFVSVSMQPQLDKRDARSRSARRNRSTESISDEILLRSSARHSRNSSDFNFAGNSSSLAGKSSSLAGIQISPQTSDHFSSPIENLPPILPSLPKSRSRFLQKPSDSHPPRIFRSKSSSACPPSLILPKNVSNQVPPLSPPRNLLKSVSCSTRRKSVSGGRRLSVEIRREEDVKEINDFLRRQRAIVDMASDGEVSIKAKFVLSSYTPDTSSMVAAICYAWLLENMRKRDRSCVKDEVVVPVINMRRARMWEHKQAAWLFHHIGIDASALIFSDELDLEGLLMGKQLSLLIVGQNTLKTDGEVGSLCTILTDKYCEDAYDLLQAPHIRRLLLAGILLDTQNLSCAAKPSTNRDSEAVQLLLVGSFLDYRDFFFQQVMKEHEEESFIESMKQHYGKHSIETKQKHSTAPAVERAAVQQTQALPPAPFKAMEKSSRVKNKFTLGRLFNFSS